MDERGDPGQREALRQIFSGALGGTVLDHFPWAWKASDPLGVEPARIEIDHTPSRGWFRAGEKVSVRVSGPYAGLETVTCVIPGHEREGRELVVDELKVGTGLLGTESQTHRTGRDDSRSLDQAFLNVVLESQVPFGGTASG